MHYTNVIHFHCEISSSVWYSVTLFNIDMDDKFNIGANLTSALFMM